MKDSKTTTHFEKLKISVEVTSLMTYLESQAEMMADKTSEKYKRMTAMIRIINTMRTEYNSIFQENCQLIDKLIEYEKD